MRLVVPLPTRHGALRLRAMVAVGVGAAALGLVLSEFLPTRSAAMAGAGLVYAPIAICIVAGIGRHAPHGTFGIANWVTLGRASLVCLLAGLIGSDAAHSLGRLAVLVGAVVLLLDGLDGWIARWKGTNSTFGAIFDREIDALFVLILSALLMEIRDLGPWILAVGGLRYAFVASSIIWPWLAAELPPSRRRKGAFAAIVCLMLTALAPEATAAWAATLAAVALVLAVCSFAVDVAWLYRRR